MTAMILLRGRNLLAVALLSASGAVGALAAEGEPVIPRSQWSFSGINGRFDKAQLQRGYRVYKEVCASCHSMRLVRYRNLMEAGGPGFTEGQVKTLAAEAEIQDGIDENGKPILRPGRPADTFKPPFINDAAARAANGGALPPDLSLMGYARDAHAGAAFEPAQWFSDISRVYQEGGTDYLHMLLQGYADKPPPYKLENGHHKQIAEAEAKPESPRCASISTSEDGKETCNAMADGLYYNKYFPGHQIAMPSPLSDDLIRYTDGSPTTVAQYAKDVAAFTMWATDPQLEERKSVGLRIMIYLFGLAALLYFAKRQVWARLGKH